MSWNSSSEGNKSKSQRLVVIKKDFKDFSPSLSENIVINVLTILFEVVFDGNFLILVVVLDEEISIKSNSFFIMSVVSLNFNIPKLPARVSNGF